ncbi:MAG: c-type cytochrome [Chloroflexi bacterium]|nr:c-type cytochrome [Chloroflexota bacterium]
MNTSKQVNVMIGLLFVTFVVTVGYLFNEANRQEVESAEINERNAHRGARLFVQNCRNCHGLDGSGKDANGVGTIGVALNAPHFLILGEDNVYNAAATSESEAEAIRTYLNETIACGRVNTYMPKWDIRFGGSLSPTQVEQLVTLIVGDPTGKHDFWDLVLEEGEHADEEQFGAVLEERFALAALLGEYYGRAASEDEIAAYKAILTPEQLVAIVDEYGRHPTAAEIYAESERQTLTRDAATITITTDNCGQFANTTKLDARTRADPRTVSAAAPGAPSTDGDGAAAPAETPTGPSVDRGTVLVEALGCLACHTLDGTELVGPTWLGVYGRTEQLEGGDSVIVDDAYIRESIRMPQAKIVLGFAEVAAMPVFGEDVLTDIDLESIILYLQTLTQ